MSEPTDRAGDPDFYDPLLQSAAPQANILRFLIDLSDLWQTVYPRNDPDEMALRILRRAGEIQARPRLDHSFRGYVDEFGQPVEPRLRSEVRLTGDGLRLQENLRAATETNAVNVRGFVLWCVWEAWKAHKPEPAGPPQPPVEAAEPVEPTPGDVPAPEPVAAGLAFLAVRKRDDLEPKVGQIAKAMGVSRTAIYEARFEPVRKKANELFGMFASEFGAGSIRIPRGTKDKDSRSVEAEEVSDEVSDPEKPDT